MRLSLIRAPKAPDPDADMGRHRFRYAILPHKNGVTETVVRAARDFNYPLPDRYVRPEKLNEVGNDVAAWVMVVVTR